LNWSSYVIKTCAKTAFKFKNIHKKIITSNFISVQTEALLSLKWKIILLSEKIRFDSFKSLRRTQKALSLVVLEPTSKEVKLK
jgi:hypothetical protein